MSPDSTSAFQDATRFLLAGQSPDGSWRDFDLPPGPSEAWTTAVVGLALTATGDPAASASIDSALVALDRLGRGGAWGYNRTTACDADTTAWVTQFLSRHRDLRRQASAEALASFLDPSGRAHTFRGSRFGAWSNAHADVTPAVGTALLDVGAPPEIIRRVREAVLRVPAHGAPWTSYWWNTDTYAIARSLVFLSRTGGIPQPLRDRCAGWMRGRRPTSSVEAADMLVIASMVGDDVEFERERLLRLQRRDGSWPTSVSLLLPPQRGNGAAVCFGDPRRLFSTAFSILALAAAERTAGGFPT